LILFINYKQNSAVFSALSLLLSIKIPQNGKKLKKSLNFSFFWYKIKGG